MLVRNIHLGIVNRVYDGIASNSWENGMDVKSVWDVCHSISSWEDGMDVKFVFTMPIGRNVECIHLWNVDMYENWKEILGLDA